MIYPETKKVDTVDTYFGTEVPDPYRWLEDDRSAETEAWVKAENKATFGYLDKIPFKDEIKQKLEKIWNYEKIGAPFKEGDYTYFYKNDGLQNQYVIYRYKTGEDPSTAEVFLDPNTFAEDGTVSLGGLSFSDNGKLAAYSISEGGSDWRKVLVMDAETKEITEDTLVDIKFSGISWREKDGFYYSSYDKPDGSELSAKTDQHKVYYHKLNTAQKEDELIFGGTPEQKHRYIGAGTTEDNKYLILSASNATSGNKLYIKDLSKPNADFVAIVDTEETNTSVIENVGSKLYIVTDKDAPNRKIVTVDAANPTPENWEDFIPETENVLSPSTGGYRAAPTDRRPPLQRSAVRLVAVAVRSTPSGTNSEKTGGRHVPPTVTRADDPSGASAATRRASLPATARRARASSRTAVEERRATGRSSTISRVNPSAPARAAASASESSRFCARYRLVASTQTRIVANARTA